MGNFSSSAKCVRDDTVETHSVSSKIHASKVSTDASTTMSAAAVAQFVATTVHSLKTTITSVYTDAVTSLSGSSVVLSDVDEAWYQELLGEVETVCSRCQRCTAAANTHADGDAARFLGASDTVVAAVNSSQFSLYLTKTWGKAVHDDDDTFSETTEETDDESKCDYSSDSDAEEASTTCEFEDDEGESSVIQPKEVDYYADDDDAETKADRLLRLASMNSADVAPIYVDDYLCPCGECPQYERIACDVQATVTWRSVKEQSNIIRVLQAFSTYNEVIGYRPEMIEAAEECLQVWLGDEDRALNSLVMLYDEVPQLCNGLRL